MRTVILVMMTCIAAALPHAFADTPDFEIHVIAENLEVPWAMDISPDGRIFFTERGGQVRVIEDGVVRAEPIKELDVGFVEGGLLGIALDPDFEENHYAYVYYTYTDLVFTYNKVVRFTASDDSITDDFTLMDRIPGGPIHDGGRIKFADDGTLYITTGDAGNVNLSQDASSLGGKILRINPDGGIPEDNPFEGSAVYSLGHRNPQGLDWDPDTGMLVISEHGPSGERGFAHDEINIIKKGANYGWPEIVGGEERDGMEAPILHSGSTTWAPSGAAFYDSDRIPEFAGRFLVATLAGKQLLAIDLDADAGIADAREYLVGDYGRLRDVAVDDDGNVYILTSNRDGRGSPAPNDDRILKISPAFSEQRDKPSDDLQHLAAELADITCSSGLEPVFRISKTPACVKPATILILIERGWALDHLSYMDE